MKSYEFHREYANLPIEQRLRMINRIKYRDRTLSDIYQRVKALEDHLRPHVIERNELLKIAEEGIELLKSHGAARKKA